LRPGQSFLEIGPGNLLLAQELLQYFSHGTLIEYSEDVLIPYHKLPVSTQTRLDLKLVDFMQYDLTTRYECVVACEVLEHVVEDEAFLRKMFVSLQDGGQIILSVPALMRFWSLHDEIVGHIRRYEKEALINLLHQVGFINVRIGAYGFPFVNWLRIPRIWLARQQHERKSALSLTDQTKKSGVAQTALIPSFLGLLVNPITIYPLAQFSTLFAATDWSGAYLVSASKPGNLANNGEH
jgi:hypothetical protein